MLSTWQRYHININRRRLVFRFTGVAGVCSQPREYCDCTMSGGCDIISSSMVLCLQFQFLFWGCCSFCCSLPLFIQTTAPAMQREDTETQPGRVPFFYTRNAGRIAIQHKWYIAAEQLLRDISTFKLTARDISQYCTCSWEMEAAISMLARLSL